MVEASATSQTDECSNHHQLQRMQPQEVAAVSQHWELCTDEDWIAQVPILCGDEAATIAQLPSSEPVKVENDTERRTKDKKTKDKKTKDKKTKDKKTKAKKKLKQKRPLTPEEEEKERQQQVLDEAREEYEAMVEARQQQLEEIRQRELNTQIAKAKQLQSHLLKARQLTASLSRISSKDDQEEQDNNGKEEEDEPVEKLPQEAKNEAEKDADNDTSSNESLEQLAPTAEPGLLEWFFSNPVGTTPPENETLSTEPSNWMWPRSSHPEEAPSSVPPNDNKSSSDYYETAATCGGPPTSLIFFDDDDNNNNNTTTRAPTPTAARLTERSFWLFDDSTIATFQTADYSSDGEVDDETMRASPPHTSGSPPPRAGTPTPVLPPALEQDEEYENLKDQLPNNKKKSTALGLITDMLEFPMMFLLGDSSSKMNTVF